MNYTVKNRNWILKAALFLISQNVSLFGSSVVAYAILWHITLETSSGTWIMLATIASTVPQGIITFFGGVLADRLNRKHLIMIADGFIALATFGLVIAFLNGYNSMWLLLVVLSIRSFGGGIQAPAVNAIYPQIVPEEHLTKIQGINQTLSSVLMLLSPAVGGIILGSVGIVWSFMLDVVTAIIAIAIMFFIHVEKHEITTEYISIFDDMKKGFSYVFKFPPLRNTIICSMIAIFLFTPSSILSPLMVERTFGSEVWRLSTTEIVWTVGSLAGGFFVSLKSTFNDKIKTISFCLIGFGVCFALCAAYPSFIWFCIFMGIAGFFMPVLITAQTVYIQELAAPDMLGRVFSIVQIASISAMPVSILIFGPLADIISIQSMIIVTGILIVFVSIIYWKKSTFLTSSK